MAYEPIHCTVSRTVGGAFGAFIGSAVDAIFQFSQIRHQTIEGRRFRKEHFLHISVVSPNSPKSIFGRAYPKASRFRQIIPRRGLAEKNLLVLYHA